MLSHVSRATSRALQSTLNRTRTSVLAPSTLFVHRAHSTESATADADQASHDKLAANTEEQLSVLRERLAKAADMEDLKAQLPNDLWDLVSDPVVGGKLHEISGRVVPEKEAHLEHLVGLYRQIDELKSRAKLLKKAHLETTLSDLSTEELKERLRPKEVEHLRKIDAQGRSYGTGRRKTSSARVWVFPGTGRVCVNSRPLAAYFPLSAQQLSVVMPLEVTEKLGEMDVVATVEGGGLTGQAEALAHGLSRALQHYDPTLRSPLKDAGLITRDPRMVERKKPGQRKARRKFQWVKR